MSAAPRTGPTPWEDLRDRLGGFFEARALGLLGGEFALLRRGGEEFGRLRIRGPAGADLRAGDLEASIERVSGFRYRMLSGGAEMLLAGPGGAPRGAADRPEIRCGERTLEARVGLLRNTAVARSPTSGEAARLEGGLAGRSYEVVVDADDGCALPVALFLLYYTATLRRRAYLIGPNRL